MTTVAGLLEDRSGNIWFARSEAGGALRTPLCQALPTKIHCLDQSDGFAAKSCCSFHVAQDTEGYLWVQTEGPLLRWKPGHFESYLPKEWTQMKGIETAGGVDPNAGWLRFSLRCSYWSLRGTAKTLDGSLGVGESTGI